MSDILMTRVTVRTVNVGPGLDTTAPYSTYVVPGDPLNPVSAAVIRNGGFYDVSTSDGNERVATHKSVPISPPRFQMLS